MQEEAARRPVLADTCGANQILPAARVGCGKPIETCAEVYRCTDCTVPFHRECAVRHFGRDHVAHT